MPAPETPRFEKPLHLATQRVGMLGLRALGARVRVSGAEHLPSHGPVLIAATHVSYLDFLALGWLGRARGRRVRFLARHDVWDAPALGWGAALGGRVVGWGMDTMRHVPVDRTAPADAYLRTRALLEAGEAVAVHPEAGISYSFTVRGLTRGVAGLARDTGVPVVPVALWGIQRLYTVGRPDPATGREPRPELRRGQIIDVSCGPALRFGPDDDVTTWTHALGHRLTDLLEDLQRLPEHRPGSGESAPWHPAHLGGSAPTRAEAAHLDVLPVGALTPSWGP